MTYLTDDINQLQLIDRNSDFELFSNSNRVLIRHHHQDREYGQSTN